MLSLIHMHRVSVLIGGVWEGPRVDGMYFQSSVFLGRQDAASPPDLLLTAHHRSVVDERQVPGAFPAAVVCEAGVVGLLPDADIDNPDFAGQVMAVRPPPFALVRVYVCIC